MAVYKGQELFGLKETVQCPLLRRSSLSSLVFFRSLQGTELPCHYSPLPLHTTMNAHLVGKHGLGPGLLSTVTENVYCVRLARPKFRSVPYPYRTIQNASTVLYSGRRNLLRTRADINSISRQFSAYTYRFAAIR